jgi:hypothetical protein
MTSQNPSQPKPNTAKLSYAGKAAAKVALMIALYVIGGLLALVGIAAEAKGASRGWLAVGLGLGCCSVATTIAKSL